MIRGLFVTGTGTGVGKTYVTALIARELTAAGHRVGVYKPVASGCRIERGCRVGDDAATLWQASGKWGERSRVCPQLWLAPLAPHLAARQEGAEVDDRLLETGLAYWTDRSDIVLVEGAGGLLSPLSATRDNADLAAALNLPLLIVTANRLGTINATRQTLLAANTFDGGLNVAGLVINDTPDSRDDPSAGHNRRELEMRCPLPLVTTVAYQGTRCVPAVKWAAILTNRVSQPSTAGQQAGAPGRFE